MAASTFNAFAKNLGDAFAPLSLVFVSEVLNCVFLFLSFGLFPMAKRFFSLKRKEFIPMIAMGFLGGVFGPMLWFLGLDLTTAVNASLFGKADIIFMLVLAHFVLHERIEKAHFLAIGSVLCGVLFVTLRGFNQGVSFQPGDLIIMAGTLSYASSTIVYRKFLSHLEPQMALFTRSVTAITFIGVLSLFLDLTFVQELRAFPMDLLPALIGFAFISRFLNSMLFYEASAYVSVMTVSLFGTFEILGSAAFAFFYLGETIEWYHFVGGAFLILGNVLLTLFRSPATKPQASSPSQSANIQSVLA